jgi:hypothetical protein
MGLVNAWVKARHAQGEVHRVKIVELPAPENETGKSHGQRKSHCVNLAGMEHVLGCSNSRTIVNLGLLRRLLARTKLVMKRC